MTETETKTMTVGLTDSQVNYAVAQWAAAQEEASDELRALVDGDCDVTLTLNGDGTATLRLAAKAPPSLALGQAP